MKNFFLLLALSFNFCASLMARNLTHEEALARKLQIKNVSYELHLKFQKNSDDFTGETTIDVNLNDLSKPLRLDFEFLGLKKALINGKEVNLHYIDGKLMLSEKQLSKNMKIKIFYEGKFGGVTLKKFREGEFQYFYTHLSPYQAHQLFPCFDQSDLKAKFKLFVSAPREWKIISNELVEDVEEENSLVTTEFKETDPIKPGVFSISGGDYVEFRDQYKNIPLKIYARKSLASQVDAPRLFEVTKKGLEYFTEYLEVDYPFSKYDQIFAPDFGYSGMENPGAITLNERYIFSGIVPDALYIKRDELILHEMAHIWFGGSVSQKWWDDLWLNESFASYFSSLALSHLRKDKDSLLFFQYFKIWGYREDQHEETSHPVVSSIPDVLTSETLLDGITYSKGASALQQLHFTLGEKAFLKAIKKYLNDYKFSNASYQDFFNSISDKNILNLEEWVNTWITSKGTHRISHEMDCENDQIKSFHIKQTPNFSGKFSEHKTTYSFFKNENEKFTILSKQGITFKGPKTSVSFPDISCPDFILPNSDDRDFGLYTFDKKSQKLLLKSFTALRDPSLRYNLLIILDQNLKHQKISASHYMDAIISWLKTENNENLLSLVYGIQENRLGILKEAFNSYLTVKEREKYSVVLEEVILAKYKNGELSDTQRSVLFDYLILFGYSQKVSSILGDLLSGKKTVLNLNPDQSIRWKSIRKLIQLQNPKGEELLRNEMTKDPSFSGRILAYSAKVATPSFSTKKLVWDEYFTPWKIPYTQLKNSSEYIYDPMNPKLNEPFVQKFFEYVSAVDWHKMDGYEDLFFHELYPTRLCDAKYLKMSSHYLKGAKNLTPNARKRWLMAHDDLRRCVLTRELK